VVAAVVTQFVFPGVLVDDDEAQYPAEDCVVQLVAAVEDE